MSPEQILREAREIEPSVKSIEYSAPCLTNHYTLHSLHFVALDCPYSICYCEMVYKSTINKKLHGYFVECDSNLRREGSPSFKISVEDLAPSIVDKIASKGF